MGLMVHVVKARKDCGAKWGKCGGSSLPTTSPVHVWDPYNLISICYLGWYQLVSSFCTTHIIIFLFRVPTYTQAPPTPSPFGLPIFSGLHQLGHYTYVSVPVSHVRLFFFDFFGAFKMNHCGPLKPQRATNSLTHPRGPELPEHCCENLQCHTLSYVPLFFLQ